jgi:hypothetical protein
MTRGHTDLALLAAVAERLWSDEPRIFGGIFPFV